MRVEVYPDGEYGKKRTYDLPPTQAAERYPVDCNEYKSYDLVVIPVDDEARALTCWQADNDPVTGDSETFCLFTASPLPLTFSVVPVNSHNPFYTGES